MDHLMTSIRVGAALCPTFFTLEDDPVSLFARMVSIASSSAERLYCPTLKRRLHVAVHNDNVVRRTPSTRKRMPSP